MAYQKRCDCNKAYPQKCDCKSTHDYKEPDLCAAMPISDAFDNALTTDNLVVTRAWIDTDGCGRQVPKCQTVSMSGDALCEFINGKIEDADFCEIIRTQVPYRGQTIGG